MFSILKQCNRILEDGRFIIINVSPVITKRPGREFESVRYPIHFDFHKILEEADFYFIDEIIWIKPEYTVPNRIAGYLQTGMPLPYKPNCVPESLLVYRKKTPFLLDENIKCYSRMLANAVENTDTSNCWYISPKTDKDHPAVFPEKLCEKVLKYYSFSGDVVLDPFAGSGTFGRVAKKMKRIPVLCEANNKYIKKLEEENYDDF
jgi:DNA modification methylase